MVLASPSPLLPPLVGGQGEAKGSPGVSRCVPVPGTFISPLDARRRTRTGEANLGVESVAFALIVHFADGGNDGVGFVELDVFRAPLREDLFRV